MRKNLIIDGQILQTSAWHRGMGTYLLQVLGALNDHPPHKTKLFLVLNSNLESDPKRTDILKSSYPNIDLVYCDLELTAKGSGADSYRLQLEALIDDNFKGDENFYLITSLFLFDFFAEFPSNCRKMLLFYDLTPLLFWRDLGGYFPPELYMGRFQRLFEADKIFAISETTRHDLLEVFGLPADRVISINGGFTKIAEKTKKPTSFQIPDNYVLFPSGDLPHKNNEVAVQGFDQYCMSNDSEMFLLITSHFSQDSKAYLSSLSKNIIFTDNVPNEELEWLYENAKLILFASKYEGLGMPVLDAIANEKPIVASDIAVFREMSKNAFYYFDPLSPNELEAALTAALSDKMQSKAESYTDVLRKYTWTNTTMGIRGYIESNQSNTTVRISTKRRIAVVALNPGIPDQIGRLTEAMHYNLSRHNDIDYYLDADGVHYREMERPTFLDYLEECKTIDISKLNTAKYKKYDKVVYLLDKSSMPSRVAQRACVLPGIVVYGLTEGMGDQAEMFKQLINEVSFSQIRSSGIRYQDSQLLSKSIMSKLKASE